MTPDEFPARTPSWISLTTLCTQLSLSAPDVYSLMCTRKLPGCLVGGTWKFDPSAIGTWLDAQGGSTAVQQWVKTAASKGAL